MADKTKIEWTRGEDGSPGATWNPVSGCTRVSPGCTNCYIDWAPPFRINDRHFRDADGNRSHAIGSTTGVILHPNRLDQPLRWTRPRKVFVNSLSDMFHEAIPDEYIAQVFAVMALTPEHTFQMLTKRHGRMRSLLNSRDFMFAVADQIRPAWDASDRVRDRAGYPFDITGKYARWPLPNLWLGVTVENQEWAGPRISALIDTPAAVRFVSCEPLVGSVDLFGSSLIDRDPGVDWVIVGGESGKGARPMHPDWARALRDQCHAAGVAFFFKQWGGARPKSGGRLLDGEEWNGFPWQIVPAPIMRALQPEDA